MSHPDTVLHGEICKVSIAIKAICVACRGIRYIITFSIARLDIGNYDIKTGFCIKSIAYANIKTRPCIVSYVAIGTRIKEPLTKTTKPISVMRAGKKGSAKDRGHDESFHVTFEEVLMLIKIWVNIN